MSHYPPRTAGWIPVQPAGRRGSPLHHSANLLWKNPDSSWSAEWMLAMHYKPPARHPFLFSACTAHRQTDGINIVLPAWIEWRAGHMFHPLSTPENTL